MALIGYARVSTDDQATASQVDELRAAGCVAIFEEKASGGDRSRPELAKALHMAGRGDVLAVVRIDRLARSLSHLLEVIEGLESRGAHFRSLHDPIDTSSPQGTFTLQVLGAAAEFERALIRERTKAGLAAARARGRIGGNPQLRRRDPAAIRRLSTARAQQHLDQLLAGVDAWLPVVRRLRPEKSWSAIAKTLGSRGSSGRPWTAPRLSRAVRRLISEGLAEQALLERKRTGRRDDRLLMIVAGIAGGNPQLSLRGIAARLQEMNVRTARGNAEWSASSVKVLLDRARALRLVGRRRPG